jgi:hypothetical protein
MNLPTIDVPIYEIKILSKDEPVKYRPFLVKEKKILMMAAESKNADAAYLAIKQIVNNCTFEKIDIENIAIFDLEYLFLKIRSKSIGENAEFKFVCEKCNNDIKSSINFDDIEIKKNSNNHKKIMINDNVGIMMKYPSIKVEKIIQESEKISETDIKIILNCVDYIFDKENIYYAKDANPKDLQNFIENLTEQQYSKIENFFKTLPKLEHEIIYKCSKCNNSGKFIVNSLYDFFV